MLFVQFLYLEPFPKSVWSELLGKNIILVENGPGGQLKDLIKEKVGFNILSKNIIIKYDGRPFIRDSLEHEIKKRLRR